jgi:DNA-directed RNA polymerase subunit RPC12/RpoP
MTYSLKCINCGKSFLVNSKKDLVDKLHCSLCEKLVVKDNILAHKNL